MELANGTDTYNAKFCNRLQLENLTVTIIWTESEPIAIAEIIEEKGE